MKAPCVVGFGIYGRSCARGDLVADDDGCHKVERGGPGEPCGGECRREDDHAGMKRRGIVEIVKLEAMGRGAKEEGGGKGRGVRVEGR